MKASDSVRRTLMIFGTACLAGCATPQEAVTPEIGLPEPEAAPQATPEARVLRNAADVRAEYGAPDFVRRETDSELWRYDGGDCVLFVFLYREADDFLLRHVETLPPGDGQADAACMNLIKARAPPVS